jgi:hypothetical protein
MRLDNPMTLDRTLPPAIYADVLHRQRRALARARRISRLPLSEEAGCVAFRDVGPGHPKILGPPAPDANVESIGHFITINIEFRSPLPRSPACRPRVLRLTAYDGRPGISLNSLGSPATFVIDGTRGRATASLPWNGRPPYHVVFRTETFLGRSSRSVNLPVACPPGACLTGLRSLQSGSERSHRPLTGVSISQLRQSFAEAASTYRVHYVRTSTSCASLNTCTVAFRSALFPRARWAMEYAINSEQRSGCWSAATDRYLGKKPYDSAPLGLDRLVGCVDWTR